MTKPTDVQSLNAKDFVDKLFGSPSLPSSKMSTDPAAPNRPGEFSPGPVIKVPAHIRNKDVPSIQMEFQMTIQPLERFGPKKAALLLTVAACQATLLGVDLPLYLVLNYLLEINRFFVRLPNVNRDATKKAIALSETVLLALGSDGWINLSDKMFLDQEKAEIIFNLGMFPDSRTLGSWAEFYDPGRFFEMKIVPLEEFQEHSENTSPYVSYTKGYSESGKGYRRDGKVYGVGKTPFDPEIDEDRTTIPLDLSSPIDEDPEYVELSLAISEIKKRNRERK